MLKSAKVQQGTPEKKRLVLIVDWLEDSAKKNTEEPLFFNYIDDIILNNYVFNFVCFRASQ